MKRTYWERCPRGFSNEFDIAVATNKRAREYYKLNGYERVAREWALRYLAKPHREHGMEWYIGAELDGEPTDRDDLVKQILGI